MKARLLYPLILLLTTASYAEHDCALFTYYPKLKKKLPHTEFTNAEFASHSPLAVQKLDGIAQHLEIGSLYIMHDGDDGNGNRLCNFDFSLADFDVTLSYVNASFELKQQIDQSIVDQPDVVVVPAGNCEVVTGILLGLDLAATQTAVYSISIMPGISEEQYIDTLFPWFERTNALLSVCEPTISLNIFPAEYLNIISDFSGTGTDASTPASDEAVSLMQTWHGIDLDPNYAGKAFACIVADARAGLLKDKTVLFWNTTS